LASQLPGERPLLEMNGDILWTQQRSSGVCGERRKEEDLTKTFLSDLYLFFIVSYHGMSCLLPCVWRGIS